MRDCWVRDVAGSGVFPQPTRYFVTPVDTASDEKAREDWFSCALAHADGCDVLLLDPDTGLCPDRTHNPQYASTHEVLTAVSAGKSVLTVQFGRPGNLEKNAGLARTRLTKLAAVLEHNGLPQPWGFWWGDRHKVGILVAPARPHRETLGTRRDQLLFHAGWTHRLVAL